MTIDFLNSYVLDFLLVSGQFEVFLDGLFSYPLNEFSANRFNPAQLAEVKPMIKREVLSKPEGKCQYEIQNKECKQWIDNTLDQLAQRLEQGYSEEMEKYLKAMAHFHAYSLHNLILILAQRPEAKHVAGFRTWVKLKRHIRKGEKGIRILAPIIHIHQKIAPTPDEKTANEEKDAIEKVCLSGFKSVYVFDQSQTDGVDMPQPTSAQGDAGQILIRLESAVRSKGILLEFGNTGSAYGFSRNGLIQIRSGMNSAETFSTLAHEFAHELLHQADKTENVGRSLRELEADAVACVVCEHFGIQSLQASADYIQMWEGDKRKLLERFERIRKCAAAIITAVEAQADERFTAPIDSSQRISGMND